MITLIQQGNLRILQFEETDTINIGFYNKHELKKPFYQICASGRCITLDSEEMKFLSAIFSIVRVSK